MSSSYLKKDDVQSPIPRTLLNLAKKGWCIKQQIIDLTNQLNSVNDKLIEQVPAGFTVVVEGLVQIPVAETQRMSIKDPAAVRKVLGDRFDDLVDSKTNYTLTKKLKTMVLSGDDSTGMSIRGYIECTKSVGLSYRAAKPVQPKAAVKPVKKVANG